MPQVTMDLAELDQLRNEKEELTKERDELKRNEKKIIIKHIPVTGIAKIKENLSYEYSNVQFKYRGWAPGMGDYNYQSKQKEISFSEAYNNGLIDFTFSEEVKDIVTYENLDSVSQRIRNEEANKVKEELTKSFAKIVTVEKALALKDTKHKQVIEEIESKYIKEISDLKKTNIKNYNSLKEKTTEKFNKLSMEFNEYKKNEKRSDIESKLAELERIKQTRIYKLFF